MSASYPTAVKSFVSRNAGDTLQPAHVNDLQDEVNAIEAGLLNGTARISASNASVNTLSVGGNSTLASTITIGTLPYIFPASGGSSGQVLTITSTSGSTMTLGWQAPSVGNLTLLKAGNGTDASAGATNLDTIAITGLTANDTIYVIYLIESSSQATAQAQLYSATDAATISLISQSPIASGSSVMGSALLRQRQGTATSIGALAQGIGNSARQDTYVFSAVTTAWTAPWTLALRHGGVTAGGTCKWEWAVYKKAGQ